MRFDQWVPDILPDVPGCPDAMVEREVRRSAIAFCRDTLCWIERLDPITPEAGKLAYDLWLPREASLVQVYECAIGHKVALPDQIVFDVSPDDAVIIDVALAPSINSETVPDHVAEQWYEAIASGAKYRLMEVPTRTWSNPQMAAHHRMLYTQMVHSARVRRSKSFGATPLRTRTFGI